MKLFKVRPWWGGMFVEAEPGKFVGSEELLAPKDGAEISVSSRGVKRVASTAFGITLTLLGCIEERRHKFNLLQKKITNIIIVTRNVKRRYMHEYALKRMPSRNSKKEMMMQIVKIKNDLYKRTRK
jgi:hypothetical protein